jgi:hypothetical protein
MKTVADVLEDAADLYESEQVDWCSGSWTRDEARGLSVCASTALAMACDLPLPVAMAAGGSNLRDGGYQRIVRVAGFNSGAVAETELYIQARVVLDDRMPKAISSVVLWNDSLPWVDGKQQVIEMFKETAKDLRNQEQG